jgi:hypothetical protein
VVWPKMPKAFPTVLVDRMSPLLTMQTGLVVPMVPPRRRFPTMLVNWVSPLLMMLGGLLVPPVRAKMPNTWLRLLAP